MTAASSLGRTLEAGSAFDTRKDLKHTNTRVVASPLCCHRHCRRREVGEDEGEREREMEMRRKRATVTVPLLSRRREVGGDQGGGGEDDNIIVSL
jgi:hypothetical protein